MNVKSTRKKRAIVVCWRCREDGMRTSVTTKARKVVGEVEDREIGFFNVSGKKPDLAVLTLSFIDLRFNDIIVNIFFCWNFHSTCLTTAQIQIELLSPSPSASIDNKGE